MTSSSVPRPKSCLIRRMSLSLGAVTVSLPLVQSITPSLRDCREESTVMRSRLSPRTRPEWLNAAPQSRIVGNETIGIHRQVGSELAGLIPEQGLLPVLAAI